MKIAHSVLIAPHGSGLYETTLEIVKAERAIGLDSRLVSPKEDRCGSDRGVPIAGHEFARDCDILSNHGGLGALYEYGQPVVHFMHSTPEYAFHLDYSGITDCYSRLIDMADNPRVAAMITMWPEHVAHWQNFLPPERVHLVNAPIDLTYWRPTESSYFQEGINIVCSEPWRDRTPFHIINAFMVFVRQYPSAKLHIYGAPDNLGIKKLLGLLGGNLGEVSGYVKTLRAIYGSADVAITSSVIATRTVREPLACGCQVVKAIGAEISDYEASPEDIHLYAREMVKAYEARRVAPNERRNVNRYSAERQFDSNNTAQSLMSIYAGVL